jgi:hypothetical protein
MTCHPLPSTFAGGNIQSTLAAPIARIDTGFHPPRKCRIRPLRNQRHVAMFDRTEVDVVHMARIISVVPNGRLPGTLLPDAAFTLRHSYR